MKLLAFVAAMFLTIAPASAGRYVDELKRLGNLAGNVEGCKIDQKDSVNTSVFIYMMSKDYDKEDSGFVMDIWIEKKNEPCTLSQEELMELKHEWLVFKRSITG